MAKYGMSLCVLGMAEELKVDGIAVNALWPRTGAFIMLSVVFLFIFQMEITNVLTFSNERIASMQAIYTC